MTDLAVVLAEHRGSALRRVVYHLVPPVDTSWRVAEDVERADHGLDLHLSSGVIGIAWEIVSGELRLWCEPRSVAELLIGQLALDVSRLSSNWAALIGSPLASLELSPPVVGPCSAVAKFGTRTVIIRAAELLEGAELRECSDEITVWFGGGLS